MIVVLADVAQNDGVDRRIEIFGYEFGRNFIRQVPAAAHHALLHRPGIRPDAQHFQVVIRFENHDLAAPQMHTQGIGHVAEIGREGHLHALRGNSEADRVDGIVRNGETGDVEIADREPATGLEDFDCGATFIPIDELRRAAREIDGQRPFSGFDKCSQAAGVIAMFMRNKNSVEIRNVFSDCR